MPQTRGNTSELQVLLDRAGRGDDRAQGELVSRAADRLLRLTRRMLRDYPRLRRWEQTDDVFQNAALRLYRSLADVQPDSVTGFFGLAATQIRRTLIDLARHHFGPEGHAAQHHSEDGRAADDASGLLEHKSDRTARPESLESWARFHEAAGRLPQQDRQVFDLVWYAGMEQQEIATLLGISVPTVKRRWRNARLALYDVLQGVSPLSEEDG